jgi:uncharacterized protein (DUF305 family)
MTRRRGAALLAAAVAAVAAVGGTVLAAHSHDAPDRRAVAGAPATSSPPVAPVRVIVPGRPGESARVTDSRLVRAPDGSTYNVIDVTFVQMMIPHHAQALAMAELADGRAGDARVGAVARRIRAAQAPEMARLRAWLSERALAETAPGHDHATMPGMQDDTAMSALRAAHGADFDRRFITMMTSHHRGALQMAGDVLSGGSDQSVSEFANELAVEQGSEIRRLADLRVR